MRLEILIFLVRSREENCAKIYRVNERTAESENLDRAELRWSVR